MSDSSNSASSTVGEQPIDASATSIPRGIGWGVLATIAMSVPMLIGMVTGVAPMPEPIPKALVTLVFGAGLPGPLLITLSVGSHLGYGGLFGALLVRLSSPVTLGKGLALGVALWGGMQVVVLPLLGWGLFGTAITPTIAVATLGLHLVYGAVLGWGLRR